MIICNHYSNLKCKTSTVYIKRIISSTNSAGSNNLLQKFWVNLTRIVSAEANFLFLKQLAELAMIVTS